MGGRGGRPVTKGGNVLRGSDGGGGDGGGDDNPIDQRLPFFLLLLFSSWHPLLV